MSEALGDRAIIFDSYAYGPTTRWRTTRDYVAKICPGWTNFRHSKLILASWRASQLRPFGADLQPSPVLQMLELHDMIRGPIVGQGGYQQ